MNAIEATFNEAFAHWNIQLPKEDIARRRAGKILQAGWTIWYRFAADEAGEFLEYYASHRLTDDRHVRVRTDGRCESLPAIRSMRLVSKDPVQDAGLDAEFIAENQRIAEMLAAKGFAMQGDEAGGVQMNRILRTQGLPGEAKKEA